jgi:phospholipase C
VLNALTSNPEVWSKTALLITFDENDGFFDHVVGPYPNVGGLAGQSTVPLDNELFNGTAGTPGGSDGVVGPYGCGVRVPLLVVSPWSAGGWVSSETFDHTSLVRFIEARFGVDDPNITPWRRAVCGDLTSAFDFESASDQVPPLPSVAAYKPTGSSGPTYVPTPPPSGSVPVQEPGVRPSRRLGYRFHVGFDADPRNLNLAIKNHGRLGVSLQARSLTLRLTDSGDRPGVSPDRPRSSSRSPTRTGPIGTSSCPAQGRSRSTPATPAAGTTSRCRRRATPASAISLRAAWNPTPG